MPPAAPLLPPGRQSALRRRADSNVAAVFHDLRPFDLESGVQVTCDVGYLCANFGFRIGLSILDLGPMYATDRRQTSDRPQTKASLNAPAY